MTLKIVLVDDEPKVLRGLEMVINRAEEDWKIVGQCKNGTEAISMISRNHPDVVITDIKMPGMNGLELVEQVKQSAPEIYFIILSGYPDFKYAQQALKLGTVDYILKPPDYRDLLASLKKLEAQKFERDEKNRKEAELQGWSAREAAFMELIHNPNSEFAALQLSDAAEFEFFNGRFILCLLKLDNVSVFSWDDLDDNLRKLNIFRDELRNTVHSRQGCLLDLHNGSYCCLLNIHYDDSEQVMGLVRELHMQLTTRLNESITVGVSGVYQGRRQISTAYKECLAIIRNKVFFEKNSIIRFGEMNPSNCSESYPLELESQYLDSVRMGHSERSLKILNDLIQQIVTVSDCDSRKFKSLIMEFVVAATRNLTEAGTGSLAKELNGLNNKMTTVDNIHDIKEILADYTKAIVEHFNTVNKPGCRKIINHIQVYVKNNYFNDVSLRQIANEFFMNESYLSDLFKRETGVSFMSYLTRFRVEQAKELLKQLDLKTYEIAEMVGYKNSKYFNKVFKKCTGMTPFEYRERIG